MRSKDYDRALAEATAHHARSKTYSGKFLRPHKPVLLEINRQHQISSALDYGCGKGAQYDWVDPADGCTIEGAFGFKVRKYDPAWPPFAAEPAEGAVWDLVICTHVLGSIPLQDLPWVVERLYRLAGKVIYVAEKLGPVGKTALSDPDGRPVGWSALRWREALYRVNRRGRTVYLSTREVVYDMAVTRRWRLGPLPTDGWMAVFSSEEPVEATP